MEILETVKTFIVSHWHTIADWSIGIITIYLCYKAINSYDPFKKKPVKRDRFYVDMEEMDRLYKKK